MIIPHYWKFRATCKASILKLVKSFHAVRVQLLFKFPPFPFEHRRVRTWYFSLFKFGNIYFSSLYFLHLYQVKSLPCFIRVFFCCKAFIRSNRDETLKFADPFEVIPFQHSICLEHLSFLLRKKRYSGEPLYFVQQNSG